MSQGWCDELILLGLDNDEDEGGEKLL